MDPKKLDERKINTLEDMEDYGRHNVEGLSTNIEYWVLEYWERLEMVGKCNKT